MNGGVDAARAVVEAFVPRDGAQREAKARILAFVDAHPDALHRTCADGHLTGSALVVDAAGARALLMHHRKLGRWLQTGGHADGIGDLAAVALQEATEESGIEGLVLGGAPVDVDVHRVEPPGEPAHLHLDVRWVAVAPDGARPEANAESIELRWFTLAEIERLGVDTSTLRLARLALGADQPRSS
jgi:hypothetical protein